MSTIIEQHTKYCSLLKRDATLCEKVWKCWCIWTSWSRRYMLIPLFWLLFPITFLIFRWFVVFFVGIAFFGLYLSDVLFLNFLIFRENYYEVLVKKCSHKKNFTSIEQRHTKCCSDLLKEEATSAIMFEN